MKTISSYFTDEIPQTTLCAFASPAFVAKMKKNSRDAHLEQEGVENNKSSSARASSSTHRKTKGVCAAAPFLFRVSHICVFFVSFGA